MLGISLPLFGVGLYVSAVTWADALLMHGASAGL
jgi:hypothetical protein